MPGDSALGIAVFGVGGARSRRGTQAVSLNERILGMAPTPQTKSAIFAAVSSWIAGIARECVSNVIVARAAAHAINGGDAASGLTN